MAVIQRLSQSYVDHELRCPDGKARAELVDPQHTGLYIEVRASTPGRGTYYLRYKDSTGKSCHARIGRTTEIDLESARAQALQLKASLSGMKALVGERPAKVLAASVPALPTPDGSILLDTFMTEHYFPYIKNRKRSTSRDDQLYRLRIKARFGQLPLTAIKRREVERFGDELVEAGQSHASANHHMQLLRRVCKLAVGWEMLERYPLSGMKLLPLDNERVAFLTDAQMGQLVNVLETHDNRRVSQILLFLLSTGARLGEALHAEWKQIDVEKAVWTIPATNSKSKKVHHKPLNVSARRVLEQLDSEGKSPYLFPSHTGRPYTTITRAWYLIRKKAGLPEDFRIHDLRHAFASRLVSAGRSLYEVQTLLGHADPRTSQRYAHLSMDRAQEASNAAAFKMA